MSLILFIGVFSEVSGQATYEDKLRLYKELTNRYDVAVKPTTTNEAITVRVDLELRQLLDVDGTAGTMTVMAWLDMAWQDKLLTWDPQQYHGLKEFTTLQEDVWVPDVVLLNGHMNVDRNTVPHYVKLSHEGTVSLAIKARLTTKCDLYMMYFPMDQQSCAIQLGSWFFNQRQMNLVPGHKCGSLTHYFEHGQWTLMSYSVTNDTEKTDVGEEQARLSYYVILRRKPLFFIVNLVIPTIQVVLIGMIGFFSPSSTVGSRREKVLIALITMMSLSTLMLVVSKHVPVTSSSIPLISLFYYCNMILVVLAIVATAVLLNMQRKGANGEPMETSEREKILEILAKWVPGGSSAGENVLAEARLTRLMGGEEERVEGTSFFESYPRLAQLIQEGQDDVSKQVGLALMQCVVTAGHVRQRLREKQRKKVLVREWNTAVDIVERFSYILSVMAVVAIVLIAAGLGMTLGYKDIRLDFDNVIEECVEKTVTVLAKNLL